MGDVVVPDVDDAVIETHRRRAAARGVSLEDEIRDVLSTSARSCRAMEPRPRKLTPAERLAEAERISAMGPARVPGKEWTLAEDLVREGRDSR